MSGTRVHIRRKRTMRQAGAAGHWTPSSRPGLWRSSARLRRPEASDEALTHNLTVVRSREEFFP